MSDEFLAVATKEISGDISELQTIFSNCISDADVLSNAEKLQKFTHKIKGLSPMMGRTDLGTLAASLDSIFKKLQDLDTCDGIFEILNDVIPNMNSILSEPDYNLTNIDIRISQIENILN